MMSMGGRGVGHAMLRARVSVLQETVCDLIQIKCWNKEEKREQNGDEQNVLGVTALATSAVSTIMLLYTA